MERTLVILKPGCLQRGLVGEVISRFEKRGLKLVAMKMVQLDEEILKVHAKNKPLAEDVNLKEVAQTTAGFTGADLENLLNEAAILAAGDKMRAFMQIPCTGCDYCVPCPKNIKISAVFSAYNKCYSKNKLAGLTDYVKCTSGENAPASACIGCGKCEQHCPQHIPIREKLDDVKKRLENPIYKVAAWGAPKVMKY